jgi:hypothetical protein
MGLGVTMPQVRQRGSCHQGIAHPVESFHKNARRGICHENAARQLLEADSAGYFGFQGWLGGMIGRAAFLLPFPELGILQKHAESRQQTDDQTRDAIQYTQFEDVLLEKAP